jgi:hypothetical protein
MGTTSRQSVVFVWHFPSVPNRQEASELTSGHLPLLTQGPNQRKGLAGNGAAEPCKDTILINLAVRNKPTTPAVDSGSEPHTRAAGNGAADPCMTLS